MKVALYNGHHRLPFWHSPSNPNCLFDPSILGDWIFKKNEAKDGKWVENKYPAVEHSIMPILNGLIALELPGVMAHVSIIFDAKEKIVEYSKRAWVQLTTEPSENDANGLPVIVKDDIVQVEHLWGGDNGTYSPYDFLDKDGSEKSNTAEFWTAFFLKKLRETKEEACKEAEEARTEAEHVLQKYSIIP